MTVPRQELGKGETEEKGTLPAGRNEEPPVPGLCPCAALQGAGPRPRSSPRVRGSCYTGRAGTLAGEGAPHGHSRPLAGARGQRAVRVGPRRLRFCPAHVPNGVLFPDHPGRDGSAHYPVGFARQ